MLNVLFLITVLNFVCSSRGSVGLVADDTAQSALQFKSSACHHFTHLGQCRGTLAFDEQCVKPPQSPPSGPACQWVHGECQLNPPAPGLESAAPTSASTRLKSCQTSRPFCGTDRISEAANFIIKM